MRRPGDLYAGRMDPQVRQLEALVAVVDAGSFTGAAAQLHLSQSAVSRSIAALESTLGARLLRRSTRQVTLTATGTGVAAQARRVLAELADLRRIVEQSRTADPDPAAGPARRSPGRAGGAASPAHGRLRRW